LIGSAWLERWRARKIGREPSRAAFVPPGLRIYAIGDIHGESRALDQLHSRIAKDAEIWHGRKLLVYLGDYVDRGDDSAGVIARLTDSPLPGFACRYLMGNHDATMLDFLSDPGSHQAWLGFGGLETLASYGVRAPADPGTAASRALALSEALAACLPAAHRSFLEGLEGSVTVGDYLFVHAGIRPGCPIDRQKLEDLLWIREPFLSSRRWHGKRVVHGHTIVPAPETLPNRIAVDTGAYAGGSLTCLVLEDAYCRFISVDNSG